MQRDNTEPVVWFLAGAAVGAALGLLFAPQSGEETRRLIASKTSEGRDRLTESGRDLYEKGREFADEAAQLFERGKNLVQG
ncbi:MAG: YtxH domain-containing protein [Bryobacteraceae bacterium]|jgi:gas vesicle protein|nr:YtxH domain-containing protein [Bryobacteraceae bacterium]